MKYRLTVLVVFLSLVLAACSLAEDITPPPGYQAPVSVSTTAPVTPTPEPNQTLEPTAAAPEPTSAGAQAATTPVGAADGTAKPGTSIGSVYGKLLNGSGSAIPDGQKITLEGFDQDASGSYQKTLQLSAMVNPDGSYGFMNVEIPPNRAFLVITSWQGVEYPSDPVFVKDATTKFSIPVIIYDKTDDLTVLKMDQVHLNFSLSSQNVMQVTEIFIVSNPGKQAVIVPSDGTTIPFIQVPATSTGVQYQLSQGSAELMNATTGFALLPGPDRQYGFIASFTMPYNDSLKFDQPFFLPVASLTAFVPQGMRLRGDQLTASGTQDVQGQTYQMYQANKMASGSTFSLTLSGKPAAAAGSSPDIKTWVLIGIAAVGVLLIGLAIYLYVRDRARLSKEQDEEVEEQVHEPIEEDALGEDRDVIIDAVIALDDQYKAGEISKDAYENRRLELKERLKGLL